MNKYFTLAQGLRQSKDFLHQIGQSLFHKKQVGNNQENTKAVITCKKGSKFINALTNQLHDFSKIY